MDLKELGGRWEKLAREDPLWAILTAPEKKGQKWKPDQFFADGRNEIADVISYLESIGLTIDREGTALDFGCGVGRLTQALAARFNLVYGVDIAPTMIELANQYNKHGAKCRYIVNARDDLRILPNATVDFIYSRLVLQHMRPRYAKGYIKEFLRVLSPRGVLVFQQPSRERTVESSSPLVSTLRSFVRQLLPALLVDLYRNKIQARNDSKHMEMYEIRKPEMLKLVQKFGGEVVDIREEHWGAWTSFQYCVRKKPL